MSKPRIIPVLVYCLLMFPDAVSAQKLQPAATGAVPGEWTLDFDAAKTAAAEKNLPIFLMGSREACGLCASAKQRIFAQAAWAKFAKENLFLVWIDFPLQGRPSPGIPEGTAEKQKHAHHTFLNMGGMLPFFALVESDGETLIANCKEVKNFHTPDYFTDLVKSHIVGSKTAAAKTAPVRSPAATPVGATIKAAAEGAKPGVWTADFEAAKTYAGENKSLIFLFVSGSDWNRQARSMMNMLAQVNFTSYARDNNILLVYADLPEKASSLPEKTAAQNRELRKKFIPPDMFPACALIASDGETKLADFDKSPPGISLADIRETVKPHLPKPDTKTGR